MRSFTDVTECRKLGKPRLHLDGIVLLHPIICRREDRYGPLIRQSRLIDQSNKLFGESKKIHTQAYRRIVLATTMWNKLHSDDQVAVIRERKMKEDNWNIMGAAGALMTRFEDTRESAEDILKLIVDVRKEGDSVYQYRNLMEGMKGLKGVVGFILRLVFEQY